MSYIKVNVQNLNISTKVQNKIGKVLYYLTDQNRNFYAFTIIFLTKHRPKSILLISGLTQTLMDFWLPKKSKQCDRISKNVIILRVDGPPEYNFSVWFTNSKNH